MIDSNQRRIAFRVLSTPANQVYGTHKWEHNFRLQDNRYVHDPANPPQTNDVTHLKNFGSILNFVTLPLYTNIQQLHKYKILESWLVLVPKKNQHSGSFVSDLGTGFVNSIAQQLTSAGVQAAGNALVGATIGSVAVPALMAAFTAALQNLERQRQLNEVLKFRMPQFVLNRKTTRNIPVIATRHSPLKQPQGTGPELWAIGGGRHSHRHMESYWHWRIRRGRGYGPAGMIETDIDVRGTVDVRYSIRRSRAQQVTGGSVF